MFNISKIIFSFFLLITTVNAQKEKTAEQISSEQIANGLQIVPHPVLYKCSKKSADVLTVYFYNQTKLPTVVVNYDTEQFILYRTESGSGVHYISDKAVFWEHHGKAIFNTEDKNLTCRVLKKKPKKS